MAIVLLCGHLSAQSLNYPICKTKYCWRSVDTQFHDGVMYMSCTVSNEKAATTSYMNYYHIVTLSLLKIQYQQLLTLHWGTLSGSNRERAPLLLTRKTSNTSFINSCNQSPLRLHKMHSQKLLTLRWRSFSEWGSDCVVYCFAKKGCQYVGYG